MMEVVVDAISSATPTINGYAATASFPPVDAIQEFKVMGANPPAEYGRSLGTVLNIVYKSGTNQFHGGAFEFLRSSRLDANNFFANSRGEELGSFKRNQFGGMIGGPILRNRTFFMASYEGLRESRFTSTLQTVPTELERRGDFSQTRIAGGQMVQIYDPFSTRPDGPNFVRSPFPGNAIPQDQVDPVARNVVKYYPAANTAGVPITNQNNYTRSGANGTDIDSIDAQVDRNLTAMQRLVFRYSHRTTDETPANLFPDDIQVRNFSFATRRFRGNPAPEWAREGPARQPPKFTNMGISWTQVTLSPYYSLKFSQRREDFVAHAAVCRAGQASARVPMRHARVRAPRKHRPGVSGWQTTENDGLPRRSRVLLRDTHELE